MRDAPCIRAPNLYRFPYAYAYNVKCSALKLGNLGVRPRVGYVVRHNIVRREVIQGYDASWCRSAARRRSGRERVNRRCVKGGSVESCGTIGMIGSNGCDSYKIV